MGIVEFFILCVVVVLIGWLAIFTLGKLAPGHPAMVDNIIWFVVVLIILVTLINAMGLVHYDPQIPKIR